MFGSGSALAKNFPFGWIRIWFQKTDVKPPTGQAEDHQLVRIGDSNWTVKMERAIIQSGWGVATSQDGERQPVRMATSQGGGSNRTVRIVSSIQTVRMGSRNPDSQDEEQEQESQEGEQEPASRNGEQEPP